LADWLGAGERKLARQSFGSLSTNLVVNFLLCRKAVHPVTDVPLCIKDWRRHGLPTPQRISNGIYLPAIERDFAATGGIHYLLFVVSL